MFSKVTIVGVGLMGGSLGMALKKKGLAQKVTGWGRTANKLQAAREKGAIDNWTLFREEALQKADLLVFATPTSVTLDLAPEWFPAAPSGCLITDLGSVKGALVEELTVLAGATRFYTSSHPLCGSEKTGAKEARENLFEGRLCILTPVVRTRKRALSRIQELWQSLGMRVVSLAPARHDRIVAAVSHLPHLLASALINQIAEEKMLEYAGTGFLDLTRIAGAEPRLWTEIFIQNRDELLRQLDQWDENLSSLRRLLRPGEEKKMLAWLRKAKLRRQKLGSSTIKDNSRKARNQRKIVK